MEVPPSPLSSRLPRLAVGPERTRICCLAAPKIPTRAAFLKEGRMEFASAKDLNRKSGVAQRRDLQCAYIPSKGPTSELANIHP
jgi:hypothetical protein